MAAILSIAYPSPLFIVRSRSIPGKNWRILWAVYPDAPGIDSILAFNTTVVTRIYKLKEDTVLLFVYRG